MPSGSFIRLASLGCALFLPVATGRASVKVTHNPAEVEHKTFDPKNPPTDLVGLNHEAAVTVSEFDLKIGLGVQPGEKRPLRNGKCQESLTIASVTLTLGLKVTVWLPDNANEKLKAHEEGHLLMTEKVYAERADKAARAAGALIDGRRFTAEAENCDDVDKAVEQTIGEANQKVYHGYLSKTADVSARAGEIYDDITRHGARADIDEKTAAAQAFDRQALEEKQSANPPTTHPAGATTKPAARPVEQSPLQISK
jgi:hypothetical protein